MMKIIYTMSNHTMYNLPVPVVTILLLTLPVKVDLPWQDKQSKDCFRVWVGLGFRGIGIVNFILDSRRLLVKVFMAGPVFPSPASASTTRYPLVSGRLAGAMWVKLLAHRNTTTSVTSISWLSWQVHHVYYLLMCMCDCSKKRGKYYWQSQHDST